MDYCTESFSLQQYRIEVDAIPPLSEDAVYELGQCVLQARTGQIDSTVGEVAKEQLALGCLHLVLAVAQRYSTSHRDDLIQEGNVGLLTAIECCPFNEKGHCIAYLVKSIRHAISNAMERVLPIRIPHSSLQKARKSGQAEQLYEMQPISLNKPLKGQPDLCLADLLEASGHQSQDTRKHHHLVEQVLAKLPTRERQILQLRYGLSEDDQREHSYAAIGLRLGMTKNGVMQAEHRAIAMLTGERETPAEWRARKMREMEARKAALQNPHIQQAAQRQQHQEMATEARLNAAYATLRQQECAFTTRLLARTAQVSDESAQEYLRRVKNALPAGIGRKTYTKLLQGYQQLCEEHSTAINAHQLSLAAGVKWRAARLFLDECQALVREEVGA